MAKLDERFDAEIEADQQAQSPPHSLKATILFKQERMKASIEKHRVAQRQLPSNLVSQAMREPLDGVELNDLMMTSKSYGDLDVGYRNYRGETALLRAVIMSDAIAVCAQINRDAKVQTTDARGWTVLMIASKEGKEAVVEALSQAPGIQVNQAGRNGETALIVAAENGHEEFVGKLLEAEEINVNQTNDNGWTPLMIAAQNGHTDVVKNYSRLQESTSIMRTAKSGHAEAVGSLRKAEAINARTMKRARRQHDHSCRW